MKYLLLIATLASQIACSSFAQQKQIDANQIKAERKPFQKRNLVLKSPENYVKRELENGKEYDHKPTVKLVDEKNGIYEFSWIGYDRKKKIVKYQREDAIEAVVEARVEKSTDDKLTYKYLIKNLPTSPTYLHRFVVQTITSDAKPIKMVNVFEGQMGNNIPEYKEGSWKVFSLNSEVFPPRVVPGKDIEFSFVSSALPGIVGCRASAGLGYTIGLGEEMPSILDSMVPFDLSAKGFTIGPIDKLAAMNKPERAKYVLENLGKFQEAGWLSFGSAEIYRSLLERDDLDGALVQAKKDLEKEFITSEVFHIIEGLNH